MRITLALSFVCLLGAAALPAQVPTMAKVEPETGKIGSVLKIRGNFLDKTKVDEVYLSDHTFDLKVKVLDQTDDSIAFRVPPFVKPGRLQVVIKTAGKEPLVIEQPVYVTIQDGKDDGKEDAKKEDGKQDAKDSGQKETLQANSAAPDSSGANRTR